MCCVSFTVVDARSSCLVYGVRCCGLIVCVGWCLFGVVLVFFSILGVVRCSLFLDCCVMFEVCVACWRYVLFVLCCVSVVVCRVGFVVVKWCLFVSARCSLLLLVIRCVLIVV